MARAASLAVDCRARGRDSRGVAYDLTREGCLIDVGNGFVGAGDTVLLRFASGVRLAGRATLLHGRIARLEFEQPLHEAIFAHLRDSDGAAVPEPERCFSRSRRIAAAARRIG